MKPQNWFKFLNSLERFYSLDNYFPIKHSLSICLGKNISQPVIQDVPAEQIVFSHILLTCLTCKKKRIFQMCITHNLMGFSDLIAPVMYSSVLSIYPQRQ